MISEEQLKENLLQEEAQTSTRFSSPVKDQSYHYFSKQRYLNGSSIFSTIFFTWISPLIAYGNKFEVNQRAIPILKDQDKPKLEFDRLWQRFEGSNRSKRDGFTLTKSIGKAFQKQLFLVCFFALFYTAIQMYQPVLMNQIMNYIRESQKTFQQGITYFCVIFIVSFLLAIASAHLFYHFAVLGFNLSNTLSLMIYNKALKHPLLTQKQYSTSDIINYSQVDAQRMTYMGFQLTALIFTPIQIIIGLVLLYFYIGISFLVGTGIMIVMMLMTLVFTKVAGRANDELLKAKDKRMKVTEQIFQIMKSIKINAQEKYFFQKLNRKREEQLKLQKKVSTMNFFVIFLYWLSTPLIIGVTFIVFIALGNQITAAKAFTTIILFKILQYPMRLFPTAISELIQMWSSIKRIEKFLLASEIQSSYINFSNEKNQKTAVAIERGTFFWGAEKDHEENKQKSSKKQIPSLTEDENSIEKSIISHDSFSEDQNEKDKLLKALNNINIQIPSQCVTMIVGDIGSGKSSLLYSILSQMTPDPNSKPAIKVNGSIAFCSQKPWIMSGTVRENIVFFMPYQQKKFKKVIYYAGLQDDIKILGKGVETEIGQKGVNLSGGQKARIGLARALYSERDIYLLDDVLSAVDVHVGKFLMQKTILGYLKNKTVIMPSHAINFAAKSDNILIMKKGQIIKRGSFKEIQNSSQFQQIYTIEKKKHEDKKGHKEEDQGKIIQQQKKIKDSQNLLKKVDDPQSTTNQLIEKLIMPQDHKRGSVNWRVYKQYIELNGGIVFFCTITITMAIWTILSALSNIEIEHWCESPENSHSHIVWFMILGIGASFFLAIRVYVLLMSGIRQGRIVHKRMIKSLLYASMTQFYNRVPIGRILNRLSKDMREVDESLGYAVGNFIVTLFSMIGNLIICLYASTPFVLIPIALVITLCYFLQRYYLKTQRQCVRLENITTSPIVSGFTSTIHGVGTIRAYNLQQEFIQSQVQKIDVNKRMRISREAMSSWFSLRLSMFTFMINMTAIGYSILSNNSNASLLGLLLTYSMSINEDIIWTIFNYAFLETKMISVERVLNFTKIQPQIGYLQYCKKWRTKEEGYNKGVFPHGAIQFNNFSVRYRKDLPKVLKNINFQIKHGEKVGIVGRTGAGKSTLLSALLRIIHPCQGQILIDGKSILEYPLKDLRSNLTMIDQEPTLIKGSFRENLDPSHSYTHEELEEIIKECNLIQIVEKKGGLDALITNQSLSVGQKQLLCICRAFLKKSKIVLIDEATANIDPKNDKMIQEVILTKFAESTVLTIAHRLSTLKHSDKILLLSNGQVLQWGSPKELMLKENGIYREMCEKNDSSYLE